MENSIFKGFYPRIVYLRLTKNCTCYYIIDRINHIRLYDYKALSLTLLLPALKEDVDKT